MGNRSLFKSETNYLSILEKYSHTSSLNYPVLRPFILPNSGL